jgi:hypothetical protein
MSTPTYDGKGQPTTAQGWLSGFTAWWRSLTPQYVTRASGGSAAKAHSDMISTDTNGSPGTPSCAPGMPEDSSGAQLTESVTGLNAPSAAKP